MARAEDALAALAHAAAHEIDPHPARVALGAEVGLTEHAHSRHARNLVAASRRAVCLSSTDHRLPPMRMARLPLLLLALVACGGASDRGSPARHDTTAATAPAPDRPATLGPCATPAGSDSLCFVGSRSYDFAGDGRPFRIEIDARGPAPDSLRVALRIVRNDSVYHRADWSTALYSRYDDGPVSRDSTRRRAAAHLARLLGDSAFVPVRALLGGASAPDAMLREAIAFDVQGAEERRRRGLAPGDTLPIAARESPAPGADSARVRALAAELRDATAYRYYAGGEATYAVAWSRAERRFVTVFSCC